MHGCIIPTLMKGFDPEVSAQPPSEHPMGENLGVDLGESIVDMVNEQAAREDGPTTIRKVEVEGQEKEFHRTRYRVALEKGKLAVDEIVDFTGEHPAVTVAIGTIAIGALLAQINKHYSGKRSGSPKRHHRKK